MAAAAFGPSDPPRQTVSLSAGPASFVDEGSGPVIVALHGLPGSARDFRWLAPHLSERARVVRIEMPGFGGTPLQTAPDRSALGRATFVLAVVRALKLERPLLVGHSMGGVIACAAADLAPNAFRALALLSSPGMRRHAMLRRVPFATLSRVLARPLLGRALAVPVQRMFALGGFRNYPVPELYGTVHCVARTSISEHAARVRRLRLPTLVAWCSDDALIESAIAEELAAACPDGPRLRFSSGGHNPQKHHAAEIAQVLTTWGEG